MKLTKTKQNKAQRTKDKAKGIPIATSSIFQVKKLNFSQK